MNDHNDHAAKARQILSEIPEDATELGTMAWCAEAQVQATLALVEQQRVANLIALARPMEVAGEDGMEVSVPIYGVTASDGGLRRVGIKADIAAALGLKEESI